MLFDTGIHSAEDARRIARRRLPWMVFDYIDGAAGRETGVARNRAALDAELTALHNDVAHAKRLSELHEEAAALFADQPPARTRRVIGNVMLDPAEGDITVARSNFTLAEIQNDEQRIFAGEYVHTLRRKGEGFEIVQKRVNLLNCDAPMGGIVIPF